MVTLVPPHVVALDPAPRATGVSHSPTIRITFDRALDPGCVTATSALLKVDARRVPISIGLADSNHTLVLHPARELEVRRTHTVTVRGTLCDAMGVGLGSDVVWQFTTLGVHPIDAMDPAPEEVSGPFTPLRWRGTEPTAGRIRYLVQVGQDSAAVAAGTATTHETFSPHLIPTTPWPSGTTLFWTARVLNDDTGESLGSGVSRLDVLPADTEIDSVLVRLQPSGTWDTRIRAWRCPNIVGSATSIPVLRFDLESAAEHRPLAAARLVMVPRNTIDQQRPHIWQLVRDEEPCRSESQAPEPHEPLAPGFRNVAGGVVFESALMTGRIQARLLGLSHPGYTIRTALGSVDFDPFAEGVGIWLYVYRVEGAGARATSTRVRSALRGAIRSRSSGP